MNAANTGFSDSEREAQGSSDGISVPENIQACARNAEKDDQENTILEPGPIRALLHRGKRRRVNLNPNQPSPNPYGVSERDQMPVQAIPTPQNTGSPPKRRRSTQISNFVSSLISGKRIKGSQKLSTDSLPSCSASVQRRHPLSDRPSNQNASSKTPTQKSKRMNLADKDASRTPQSHGRSKGRLKEPRYMTRSATKRSSEQQPFGLSERSLAISRNEGNVLQSSPDLPKNPVRSSKPCKTTRRLSHEFFSKFAKADGASAVSLKRTTSFENLNPLAKKQINAINADSNGEKKDLRKQRPSGFNAMLPKKSPPEKSNCDASGGDSEPKRDKKSSTRRRSYLLGRTPRDEEDANDNNINDENLSLRTVLGNKEISKEFRDFLVKENSAENFDFWMICERYKRARNLAKLAREIRRRFLTTGALEEVNLDAETKSKISASSRIFGKEYFVEAQEAIFCLMKEPFRRFLSGRMKKSRKTERE